MKTQLPIIPKKHTKRFLPFALLFISLLTQANTAHHQPKEKSVLFYNAVLKNQEGAESKKCSFRFINPFKKTPFLQPT